MRRRLLASPPFLFARERTLPRELVVARSNTDAAYQNGQSRTMSHTRSSRNNVEAGAVLWSPSRERVESSRMLAFARLAGERSGRDLRR